MTSNIVVVKIPVTTRGTLTFFQVSIPADAESIVGIETGIVGINTPGKVNLTGKNLIGTIKLQSEQVADLCYSSQVFFGTGSLETMLPGFDSAPQDLVNLFTFPFAGSTQRGIEQVVINNSYTLYGCYEDLLGKELNQDVSYTISLCLWTKVKETVKQ